MLIRPGHKFQTQQALFILNTFFLLVYVLIAIFLIDNLIFKNHVNNTGTLGEVGQNILLKIIPIYSYFARMDFEHFRSGNIVWIKVIKFKLT